MSLNGIEGAADVKVQQVSGFPTLDIAFDRATIGRYGLTVEDVAQSVAVALGGREAGLVFEGDRRFDIVVRLSDADRNDFDQLGTLPIALPNGDSVPLRAVADFEYEFQMVGMNRALDNSVETVFLMAEAKHQAIASKLVKEIARLDGDVSKFVTPSVNAALRERLG